MIDGVVNDKTLDSYQRRVPDGKFTTPPEVAYLVCALASHRASGLNGEIIAVDHGFLVKGV